MKKIILGLALIVMTLSANAQVRFGVKAGMNISTIRVSEGLESDYKPGFHAGVILDMPLSGNFYFNPQLVFSQMGCKQDGEVLADGDIKATLNYLQLPLDFNYRYPLSDKATLDCIAGPYIALGLSSKTEVDMDGSTISTDKGFFGEDGAYKRFDCGIRVGIGTHIGSHAGLSVCYNLGLSNLIKEDSDMMDIPDDYKEKNGAFQISLSWTF